MKAITERNGSLWGRLAWFGGLWAGGVAAVALVAGAIRFWLFHGL